MDRSPAVAFMAELKAMLRPIDSRDALLDEALAQLLSIDLPRLRSVITRNLLRIPEGEVFHPASAGQGRWALTELGALMVISRVRTPQTSAICVEIIRELVKNRQGAEVSFP